MRTTPGNPLPKILSASDFPTLRVGDGGHSTAALRPFFYSEDCPFSLENPRTVKGMDFEFLRATCPCNCPDGPQTWANFTSLSLKTSSRPRSARTLFAIVRAYIPVPGIVGVSSSFRSYIGRAWI